MRIVLDTNVLVSSLLSPFGPPAQVVRMVSSPLPAPLPDPKDEAFLEIALAGGAEYLVTGNGSHFPETLCEGVRVVSPAGFLAARRQRGAT